ncbi:hypothetical protein Lalb_Chr09g0333051 [Lupinus albus]|uniref:Uncharacterized protein n=1 Tax=Lupinus albus TaxID=3870 RepID=A0A6A4Q1K9_LUPAL|nr:hypothetical protein Lalb_Chr09g0333051 [Lupinus albus]
MLEGFGVTTGSVNPQLHLLMVILATIAFNNMMIVVMLELMFPELTMNKTHLQPSTFAFTTSPARTSHLRFCDVSVSTYSATFLLLRACTFPHSFFWISRFGILMGLVLFVALQVRVISLDLVSWLMVDAL